ncbi:hypothetical protein BO78DRAFT_394921 [Aspergillus sclerotiicarbonarius CBS 121057]|uniref:Fungal-type protein kinase domain-containing protein n=1 Tax=Aspergillus sclerotiicarbonarius (strain CBS 121057 / IBT 28362) TaxID=1448318 RepID=A0A319EGK6_ASPSB|nr:hypothetical protein BO78DRAFT_394921 [Aspergillus sclerotiicarbonarius CBS 121057]
MATQPVSAFYRHVALFSALSAVKPNSAEAPVSILWTNICIAFFPLTSGFKLSNKEPVLQDETQPDCVVFQVVMTNPALAVPHDSLDLAERQIFIVECKRPSKDTPAEWASARVQLAHYCEGNVNGTTRIFGATAVGTKVKFWRYDYPTLTTLVPGVDSYDLLDAPARYQAEQCLEYIRDNGWNWVQSGTVLP